MIYKYRCVGTAFSNCKINAILQERFECNGSDGIGAGFGRGLNCGIGAGFGGGLKTGGCDADDVFPFV